MVDFQIGALQGFDKVIERMRDATVEMRGKIMRSSVRKGANVVRNAAKQGWQRVDRGATPNKIYENVAVQFGGRTFKRTGNIMFRVGIRGGSRQYAGTAENRRKGRVGASYKTGGTTFYWRFLELGTQRIQGRGILQKALFENGPAALNAIVSEAERQFRKLGVGTG